MIVEDITRLAEVRPTERIEHWRVERLRPHPGNPRGPVQPVDVAELADSIRQQGVLQPLIVCPDGTVIAGHRRLAAAQLAGVQRVPVIVRDLAPAEQLAVQVVENVQRADLTPVQEARAYQALIDLGVSRTDVARRIGKPPNHVTRRLTLLRLDELVQRQVETGALPVSWAEDLARAIPADAFQQRRLAAVAVKRQMTGKQFLDVLRRANGALSMGTPATNGHAAGAASKNGTLPPDEPPDLDAVPTLQPGMLSRTDALAALRGQPGRTISFGTLAELADGVCGVCDECGMESVPAVCLECPLPILVSRILRAGA